MLSIAGDRLIWEHDHQILWIEPWGENSLRVRATCLAEVDESRDWALLPPTRTEASLG